MRLLAPLARERGSSPTRRAGYRTPPPGCTTDRECIALSNNPRALCVDSECTSPCENDAECNSGRYRFQECVDDSCLYVGCDTDEECRIFLAVPPCSGASALCRE